MDQQQQADLYEPSPRFDHVAASVSDVSTGQLVIVWGGETPGMGGPNWRPAASCSIYSQKFGVNTMQC